MTYVTASEINKKVSEDTSVVVISSLRNTEQNGTAWKQSGAIAFG